MLDRQQPPRLIVRTLLVSFASILLVTGAVFLAESLAHSALVDYGLSSPSWLGLLAGGATLLGALLSFHAARAITQPIDQLSRAISHVASERRFDVVVPRTGQSREVDALADSFNTLVGSLRTAEAHTRGAYIGVIESLAAALDARDQYTAGHSERVSRIAVAIGQAMSLAREDLDILRLGALLHDIGKIGVRDSVLGKVGPLTPEEYQDVKTHTHHGARILQPLPFLAPYLPIVELHHERPDGLGYPYGLKGDDIPIGASIVRVADAFDAMTSARAYRPAMTTAEAMVELRRHAGSHFDQRVVAALAEALPHADEQINVRSAGVPVPDADGEARAAAKRMSDSGTWRVFVDTRSHDSQHRWAGI